MSFSVPTVVLRAYVRDSQLAHIARVLDFDVCEWHLVLVEEPCHLKVFVTFPLKIMKGFSMLVEAFFG